MRLFEFPSPLPETCASLAEQRCRAIARQLPPTLRSLAGGVAASQSSWEWKHFWADNADLWLRQRRMTKGLVGTSWESVHDAVFDDWNRSEFAQLFMRELGTGERLLEASHRCLDHLAGQLSHWAARHHGVKAHTNIAYVPQFDLGDFPRRSSTLQLFLGEGQIVELHTWDNPRAQAHLGRIRTALGIIKTHSPDSYLAFRTFTRRVTPIKQKELVSYSLQTLPGHSFINLYHRDELDLLDDLLHENGHHWLNHHLILDDLLREDPDQIYYSPWRRTLRPVRGIYHAHFTFFFALKLYHDLASRLLDGKLTWPRPLTAGQQAKIFLRFLEEWWMLDYTAVDLARARRRGQVKMAGQKIFAMMEAERARLATLVPAATRALDTDGREAIEALRLILKTQAKLTRG